VSLGTTEPFETGRAATFVLPREAAGGVDVVVESLESKMPLEWTELIEPRIAEC